MFTLIAQTPGVIGKVQPPPGVSAFISGGAGGAAPGLVEFASNMIQLITVIAGIWALFNLVMAGFKYIYSANDVKGVETAWQSIYMSLIGLIIILSSFTVAALIGFIFFGDPMYILNPEIKSPV